jgi:hutW protein
MPMFARRENEHYDYPQLSIFRNNPSVDQRSFLISSAQNHEDTMIYIHIPFCTKECIFCNYYKTAISKNILKEYFNCLHIEIKHYAQLISQTCLKLAGIHFGGGTPSIVPIKYYYELLEHITKYFDISNCQISFEGNVLSLLRTDYISQLHKLGINRVSFGVQTFNMDIRSKYGLFSSTEKIREVVYVLHANDISDINTDLMFNFPGQLPENVTDDIHTLFEIDVNCIDLYSLIVFPNTKMQKRMVADGDYLSYINPYNLRAYNRTFLEIQKNKDIFFLMSNTITRNPNYENKNLNIMLGNNTRNGGNVIGIGASARGYINSFKYKNYVDIQEYLSAVKKNGVGNQLQSVLSSQELEDRLLVMFPNFTKINKINLNNLHDKNVRLINEYLQNNIFLEDNSFIYINPKYYYWAGNISSTFYSSKQKKDMLMDVLQNRKENLNMYNQDKMNI